MAKVLEYATKIVQNKSMDEPPSLFTTNTQS